MTEDQILVIDDDPQIRRVLRAAIVAAGYEVMDAATGEAALDILRARKFDADQR